MIRQVVFSIGLLVLFISSHAQQQPASDLISIRHSLFSHKVEDTRQEVDSFHTLHLMLAGNIYQTEKHVNFAYDQAEGKYNFKNELKYIQPILNLGDISIANLKTSFGDNTSNMFSAPDEFALAIKYSGINVVMHANLHTANVDKATLKRTRDLLNDFDMYHTGAFTNAAERLGNYPLIINKKGVTLAILNYTSLPSRPAVSRDFMINELDKFYIDRDMRLAQVSKPDFIIVYFDWNDNGIELPTHQQQELAKYVFEKGADLVIGTNPNVPMKMDYISYFYNGKPRDGMVAYSLGNLLSSNEELRNRNGYVIDMELTKNNFTRETRISDWGVIPVHTYYDTTTVSGKTKVFSLPCWAVESGDIFPNIPYIEKRRVVNGAYTIRKLLGSVADEIQYNLNEHIVDNVGESIHITGASLNNKFSPKREWDIKPTAAPATPAAGAGSLALVSEEVSKPKDDLMNKAAAGKSAATPKTKGKGDDVFVSASTPKNVDVKRAAAEADMAASKAGEADPANIPTLNAAANEAPSPAINSAPVTTTATTENNTPAAATEPVKENTATLTPTAPVKSAPVATEAVAPAKPIQVVNNSSAITTNAPVDNEQKAANKKTAAAPVTATEEATPKKSAAPIAGTDDERTKGKTADNGAEKTSHAAANTNYHTTGNNYELKENAPAAKKAAVAPPVAIERPKEKTVEAVAVAPDAVSTQIKPEGNADLNTVKEHSTSIVVDTFYRIQFYALRTNIPLDTNYYTHLKGYEVYEENGMFKYLLGRYKSFQDCYRYWKSQIQPRYKESFIVKYIDGKRVID